MNVLKELEKKLGPYAVSGIINYVIGMQILGIVLYLLVPEFVLDYLILNPIAIMRGQIWRIFTFFIFPPAFTDGTPMSFVLLNALALYCIRMFGMIVEQVWGKFRFNCYIVLGVILNVAVSLIAYKLFGLFLWLTPIYLVYSFFFVFALMFPDTQVLLMLVLPIKAKWLAVGEAVLYIYGYVNGGLNTRAEILVCLVHMMLFFAWMTLAGDTNYKQKKRQKEFQRKIKPMAAAKTIHRCAVCGRTGQDSPGMEFRFCSKCEGSYEYCMDHLYTHTHVKGPDSEKR